MKKFNVIHVLYTYFPDVTGSSIRSEGVLTGQLNNNINAVAISSPFQKGYSKKKKELINNVEVYRTYDENNSFEVSEVESSLFVRIKKLFSVLSFARQVEAVAKEKDANIIHAHSMFYCAFAAFLVSKRLNIPLVYEFRSLWEERFNRAGFVSYLKVSLSRTLETLALNLADKVVVINKGLKEEIISRGIKPDKIIIVPNAVAQDVLDASSKSTIPRSINTFGYVGNYSEIEGLDILIDAFVNAFPIAKFPNMSLFFYGRGSYESKLNCLIQSKDDNRIKNLGAFNRENVEKVYSKIDCIVNPRKKLKISDLVTPLKPLEAMAFKKLLIGSDCKGIIEVCGIENNALFFIADNLNSLTAKLKEAVDGDFVEVIANANKYVRNERTWSTISYLYRQLYSELTE